MKNIVVLERNLLGLMIQNESISKSGSKLDESNFTELRQDIFSAIKSIQHHKKPLLTRKKYEEFLIKNYGKNPSILVSLFEYDKCSNTYVEPEDYELYIEKIQKEKSIFFANQVVNVVQKNYNKNKSSVNSHNIKRQLKNLLNETTDCNIDFTCASQVQTKPVNWLWYGRIVAGKTNLLSGEPSVGKGALYADITARLTTGKQFPFSTSKIKCKVLILSAEDDYADTITPRLKEAGADLNNVFLVNGKSNGQSLTLDTDLELLRGILRKHLDIGLIVIDPITAYTGQIKDIECEVRNFLKPIEQLAQNYGVAILMIKHFKKGFATAKERTSGSVAWTASVRVALGVSTDKEDDSLKYLYTIKNNLTASNKIKTITYKTVPSINDPEIVVIEWKEETDHQADFFTNQNSVNNKLIQCETLLKEELKNGCMEYDKLLQIAEDVGCSKSTLWLAKDKLKIRSHRIGFGGKWSWSLPLDENDQTDKTNSMEEVEDNND